jgi:tetratricopeptide (TPR) repeat protein
VLGKEHPDTLTSMNNLANSLRRQGKYAEAEALDRQTLQLMETVLGKEHPDTLTSMNNLANSLRRQGKYAEAEALDRQTLQLRETVLGKEHPDTLISMSNLAISLRQQRKYAEAEAIYRRADLKSPPQDRLNTTTRKRNREAGHEDTCGPRRSNRIKEREAGS